MIINYLKGISASFASKAIGFYRIRLLLQTFGIGLQTDFIILFSNILWLFFNNIPMTFMNALLLPSIHKQGNTALRHKLILKYLKISILISLIFYFIFFIYPTLFFKIMSIEISKFNFEDINLYIRIGLLLIVLFPLNIILTLFNQYKENYFIGSINIFFWNLSICAGIIIGSIGGDIILYYFSFLIIGTGFTIILQHFTNSERLQFGSSYAMSGLNVNGRISFNRLKKLILPLSGFLLMAIPFLDIAFISHMESGLITYYDILIKIPFLFSSIIIASSSNVFFNQILIDNDSKKVKLMYLKFLLILVISVLMLQIIFYFFSKSFIHIIYGISNINLDVKNFFLVAWVLVYFQAKFTFLNKIILYKKDQKSSLTIFLVGIIINAVGNYMMFSPEGFEGIIISTLASWMILSIFIEFKYGLLSKENMLLSLIALSFLVV